MIKIGMVETWTEGTGSLGKLKNVLLVREICLESAEVGFGKEMLGTSLKESILDEKEIDVQGVVPRVVDGD